MCPSLIQIGSKTTEKNSAQTNKQTNRQTDKQTNKQTDRHYENNGHLAVYQLLEVEGGTCPIVPQCPIAGDASGLYCRLNVGDCIVDETKHGPSQEDHPLSSTDARLSRRLSRMEVEISQQHRATGTAHLRS